MLKGIPTILSPELLKVLAEMGHGDTIVLGDSNFPANSNAQRIIRADGHKMPELLDAILTLFPLDTYAEYQAGFLNVVPGDPTVPVIWDTFKEIIAKHEDFDVKYEYVERFEFYERTKQAYAVISTGETALYADLYLKKGVIKPE